MSEKITKEPINTLIVLLNMGGPQNKDEIHPYLKELFQDRELLKLPFQKILGRFIAWRRTPKIQERYEEIGQYSPTKKIMEDQCDAISKELDLIHPDSAPHKCVSGFRYCSPRTGEMISEFDQANRIILFLNIHNTVALLVAHPFAMHIDGLILIMGISIKIRFLLLIGGGIDKITQNYGLI